MENPKNTWYMITLKTKIIAAMLYIDDSASIASIHMLSAHPDYHGQGLGKYLLRKAELVAREARKTNIELSAAHPNLKLIEYYGRYGFKKKEGCKEEEYFPPDLQKEYLIPEYQGYEEDGKAKLRNYV